MSIYKHNYRAYTGTLTPIWSRIFVIARYALGEAWSSKITVGLFTFSLLPVVIYLVGIYLANNPLASAVFLKGSKGVLAIDAAYFLKMLEGQCWLALAITAWIAPRLITFDLADNALPILLSHPISRFGYVLGKFLALIASLSVVTWIPCLLLFAFQSYSSAQPWLVDHLSIGGGLLIGSLIWITLLSMLGLALSSWVKWRVVATGIIFAAVFVPAGVGGIVSAVMRTRWGLLLNLPVMMTEIWQRLLGAPNVMRPGNLLPNGAMAGMLVSACVVFVLMLNARVRAREVVRG
jgi:ABC-type transport system involved in multi-copper enzyme maturation permease subunit